MRIPLLCAFMLTLAAAPAQAQYCEAGVPAIGIIRVITTVQKYIDTIESYLDMFGLMSSSADDSGRANQQAYQSQNAVNTHLTDTKTSTGFQSEKAIAEGKVAESYSGGNRAVCQMTREGDLADQAQDTYKTALATRSQSTRDYLMNVDPASARGPISNIATYTQNKYLANGFCDPAVRLPGGLTCNPAGPPDKDLDPESILNNDINPANAAWRPRAAELFVETAMNIPPAVPSGALLAQPAGRAQFVATQSWAAKAGIVTWILTTTESMGRSADLTSSGGTDTYGRYSYRKALEEMAKGKFDAANPMVGAKIHALMGQDSQKNNVEAVAFKIGNVQARLLWEILVRMEQIVLADAVLVTTRLDRKSAIEMPMGGIQK